MPVHKAVKPTSTKIYIHIILLMSMREKMAGLWNEMNKKETSRIMGMPHANIGRC